MPNPLDTFIEAGNQHALTIMSDTFTWASTDYEGTVSDLQKDEFFSDDGAGTKRNAERLLEANVSQFGGTLPAIKALITYDGTIYQITEIESQDTTNVVYRIRQKMEVAT